jgi:signal transduction histidine kinase
MLYSGIFAAAFTPWKNTIVSEKFADSSTDTTTITTRENNWAWVALLILIAVFAFELALAFWAVYLSWTSNSLVGWNVFAKIFFAIFAFLFALNYLLIHLFNKWDLTSHIRDQNARISALEFPPLAPLTATVTGGGASRREALPELALRASGGRRKKHA